MNLKKYLEKHLRGWLPKEPNLPRNKVQVADAKTKVPKPRWWKPLWITALFMVIIFGVVNYFLLHYPLTSVIGGMAVSLLGVGIAYYIRVRPSMTANRVVYILGGIGIGWVMWVIYAITGIGGWVTDTLGVWPSLIIGFAVFYTIGALIGDWIGKRRNYQLPLSP